MELFEPVEGDTIGVTPIDTIGSTVADAEGQFDVTIPDTYADTIAESAEGGWTSLQLLAYIDNGPGGGAYMGEQTLAVAVDPDGMGGYQFTARAGMSEIGDAAASTVTLLTDRVCSAAAASVTPLDSACALLDTNTTDATDAYRSHVHDPPGSTDPHTYPSSPCPDKAYPAPQPGSPGYATSYVTLVHDHNAPLMDVSANSGDHQVVTMGTSASSYLTVAESINAAPFSESGSQTISNSASSSATQTVKKRYTKLLANYRYHDIRTYYCTGYNTWSQYTDRIKPVRWNGTLAFKGTTDRQALSAKSYYDSAKSSSPTRAGVIEGGGGATQYQSTNTSWSYSVNFNGTYATKSGGTYGLTASMHSQQNYGTSLKVSWANTASSRRYWYGWTDKPFVAHRTYVCDC